MQPLHGGSVSVSLHKLRVVESVGLLMVSLTPLTSIGSPLPDVWLYLCETVSNHCWLKPLRRQLCYIPDCKISRVTVILSVFGSLTQNESQFGVNIGWLFRQSLPHLYSCISCTQTNFGLKIL